MRFGWLTLSLSPSPEEDADRIDQQIEQVRFAERLGFGDVWLTEHYFTGESVYNDALLFASAVAMRTERIRIGFAVVQLPFHHPVRLAVQLALLDNLSRGRIDVGVADPNSDWHIRAAVHACRSPRQLRDHAAEA
jgi:alkanesulfonate monooxygenase SsuD/methylene tetrahydromethanopterin reductase-like flavin-dependent oxidoreductase (luciferase family)